MAVAHALAVQLDADNFSALLGGVPSEDVGGLPLL